MTGGTGMPLKGCRHCTLPLITLRPTSYLLKGCSQNLVYEGRRPMAGMMGTSVTCLGVGGAWGGEGHGQGEGRTDRVRSKEAAWDEAHGKWEGRCKVPTGAWLNTSSLHGGVWKEGGMEFQGMPPCQPS